MKKILALLSIVGFVFSSCSSGEDLVTNKVPIKMETTYFRSPDGEGGFLPETESLIEYTITFEFIYNENNKLVGEKRKIDEAYTDHYVYVYKDGKIIRKETYNISNNENSLVNTVYFEYTGENITKKTEGGIITEYFYDSNSKLIKRILNTISKTNNSLVLYSTDKFEYLDNNKVKETYYMGESDYMGYIIKEYDNKHIPMKNINEFHPILKTENILLKNKVSAKFYDEEAINFHSEINFFNENSNDGFLTKTRTTSDFYQDRNAYNITKYTYNR